MLDAHDLSPGGVMALVPTLGGQVERILVVGVQPLTLDDGIGLSEPVRAAVGPAADMVVRTVDRELGRLCTPGPPERAEGGGEMKTLFKLAGLAAIGAVVWASLPDVKRYLEMRRM